MGRDPIGMGALRVGGLLPIRCTNQTHITREPDALDADAPDAFYQQPSVPARYKMRTADLRTGKGIICGQKSADQDCGPGYKMRTEICGPDGSGSCE